jgi:hypothetical protein
MLIDYKMNNNKRIDEITTSIRVFIRVFGKMFKKDDFEIVLSKIKSYFNLETFDKKKYNQDQILEESIKQLLIKEQITYNPYLASKIEDTYEGLYNLGLNSCIILGETETFKSTIIRLYKELIKEINPNVNCNLMHINPRIVETKYLFGFTDSNSKKFVEGVMSKIVKSYYQESEELNNNEDLQ